MERRSLLHSIHEEAGARFETRAGWVVPVDHGRMEAEYEALCRQAALLDLSSWGTLRVTGRDRVEFLNNMLTNDLRVLGPGRGCHAVKLTVQGKMEAAVHVLCSEDELLCDLDPGALASFRASLEKHLIMEDVKLVDVTESIVTLSVQGPQASRFVESLGVSIEPMSQDLAHANTEMEGARVRIVRHDRSGETGYDIWVSPEDAPRMWRHLLSGDTLVPAGIHALDLRRIENGIPWHGSEITPEYFPIEAGLEDGWISYTKGCYLGQETISRLHHMGHVNRSLRGLRIEGNTLPEPGTTLLAGEKKGGRLTSVARSLRTGKPVGLGYVHREFSETGTELAFETAGRSTRVSVADFPLD